MGDVILFLKITGRILSAPTDSNEHLTDKPEFVKNRALQYSLPYDTIFQLNNKK